MTKTMTVGQVIKNAKIERPFANPVVVAARVTKVTSDVTGRPLFSIYREDLLSNSEAVRILSIALVTI